MARRHHRERHALMILWHFDGPQVPDEASSDREAALRRWRGQYEADEDEKREQ